MCRKNAFTVLWAGWFFLVCLTGFAEAEIVAQKSGPIRSLFKSNSKDPKDELAELTDAELLTIITGFADSYADRITQANLILQDRLPDPEKRMTAYNIMVQSLTSA